MPGHFIQLTEVYGNGGERPILVRPDKVSMVRPRSPKEGAILTMEWGEWLVVLEDVQAVRSKCSFDPEGRR